LWQLCALLGLLRQCCTTFESDPQSVASQH
jgi:hypothetical protein